MPPMTWFLNADLPIITINSNRFGIEDFFSEYSFLFIASTTASVIDLHCYLFI